MSNRSIKCLLSILTVVAIIGAANLSLLTQGSKKLDQSVLQLKQNLSSLIQQNHQLNEANRALAAEIRDIHQVELAKPQKNMKILSKYSIPIQLSFRPQSSYEYEAFKIWKLKDNDNLLYSEPVVALKESQWRHFQIVISKTQASQFSIGVMTEAKRQYCFCGYCNGNDMLYIYGQNSRIYHGEGLFTREFKESKQLQIVNGDAVTVFISKRQVIWYLNSMYVGEIKLNSDERFPNLYPFIILSQKGDSVTANSL